MLRVVLLALWAIACFPVVQASTFPPDEFTRRAEPNRTHTWTIRYDEGFPVAENLEASLDLLRSRHNIRGVRWDAEQRVLSFNTEPEFPVRVGLQLLEQLQLTPSPVAVRAFLNENSR
jgi:hypothetical protein